MISRVLVPMDESDMAEEALKYAFEVFPEAEITVLHVVGEPSSMMGAAMGLVLQDDIEQSAEDLAEDVLDHARNVAKTYDRDIETMVGGGNPANVIVEMSEDFDTIVVGSHGGSIADRLFVGNVAEKVVRRSSVPVTVVR